MKRVIVISCIFIIRGLLLGADSCQAQIHVTAIRPDRAAPGMNVVLEVLTLANDPGHPFGNDGLATGDSVVLVNPHDTSRVVFGPPEVSWNGRMLQIPIIILPNASLGPLLFYIYSPVTASY